MSARENLLEQARQRVLLTDGAFGTEIQNWQLTEADYAWVTRELIAVANRHARGRIVSTLEGGYALSALGRSVGEHIRELLAA